ncbi:MAG: acetyl-CoA carboxylase carboxyltransferase subunit alpha [Puniceicoccaceae bacterium]|nr:MAG: acetyl-CoA carboxylase carboxyltransferase subunit alpha [Puniceicoccaceae bacterium]
MDSNLYILEFEKPLRELSSQLQSLQRSAQENQLDLSADIASIEAKLVATKRQIYSSLSAWQRVQLARHPRRPYSLDYIRALFTGFEQLHGDRLFRDDPSIVGGPALFDGRPVMLIAQQKGRNTKENLLRNFGMPNPEGYRKALRLMKMADKFGLPVICLVDTPGAFPGIGAEERHVAEAIAVNLREMASFGVPQISVVIGEGGSGGALGIAVTDRVYILENAYYSVISPESCSAILWKDKNSAAQAATALRLGDQEMLKRFGIVDGVVPEPLGGAHNDPEEAAANLRTVLSAALKDLSRLSPDELRDARYQRFRALGAFEAPPQTPAAAPSTETVQKNSGNSVPATT